MKSRFLFPYWCRYLGLVLILVHIPIVLFKKDIGFDLHRAAESPDLFNSHHVFFMTTTLLMAVGLFLVAFAKEKIEDEQILQLRLDSLQWAIYINYIVLVISLIFTKDTEHILFLNLLIPLVFFIIRFRWKIFQNNRLIKE
jgi:hypothetical protein